MTSLLTTDSSSAIAGLKAKWDTLDDLGRAAAVHALHLAGVSLRALAKILGCSPSLLRNLNLAAQASLPDQHIQLQS